MALQDGFPSANGLADANDVRLALAGLVVRDSSGNPRTGIFFRNTTALVTSTATMNSSVAAFEAAVSRSGQGVILLPNTGATNVLHDPAPVSNSRYDTIYVKQNDAVAPNADANNLPVFGILKGTPSASPILPTYATAKVALDAAPGIGAGAEPLATVLIPSTATSMQSSGVVYTQLYQYTAAAGGTVPFPTKSDLDLWMTAPNGTRALVLATDAEYRRSGGTWKQSTPQTNMQLDTTNSLAQTITQIGSGKIAGTGAAFVSELVTFPIAFASTPRVIVTSQGGRTTGAFNDTSLPIGALFGVAFSKNATTFSVGIMAPSGGVPSGLDWYYDWIAIGVAV